MNVVGKVGSLISQGVYSVATPFHPFGGAVDVIVVQQQDGTFRSTPWYVRFGKFQGVLKGTEKMVRISVNGVEADFHMYLDHSGEAYFVKEVSPSECSDTKADLIEDDDLVCAQNEPSNDEKGNFVRHERTDSGMYYEFPDDLSSLEESVELSEFESSRYDNVDKEHCTESQNLTSEVVLVSVDGHILTAPISSLEKDTDDDVELSTPKFHLGPGQEPKFGEDTVDFTRVDEAWTANYLNVFGTSSEVASKESCGTNTASTPKPEVCAGDKEHPCKAEENKNIVKQESKSMETNPEAACTSIRKDDVFKSCLDIPALVNHDTNSKPKIIQDTSHRLANEDGDADSVPRRIDELACSKSSLPTDGASSNSTNEVKLTGEHKSVRLMDSEKSPVHSAVLNTKAEEEAYVLIEKTADTGHMDSEKSPVHSAVLNTKAEEEANVPIEKTADTGHMDSEKSPVHSAVLNTKAEEEANLLIEKTADTGHMDSEKSPVQSAVLKKKAEKEANSLIEKSADTGHMDSEKSLVHSAALNKNTEEEANALIEKSADTGHIKSEITPSSVMQSAELEEKVDNTLAVEQCSPQGSEANIYDRQLSLPPLDKATSIVSEAGDEISELHSTPSGGRWRLWPMPFRRVKTLEHTSSMSSIDEVFVDSLSDSRNQSAETTPTSTSSNEHKQFLRINVPTTEHIASLNLKEGQNMVTFSFSTRVLGMQQVDAHIYLWKWNARIVISDVDGTITKSDVLGQFMPLVGRDWTQSGVTRLFSAIKENGYQLLFLSARAIVQAYLTRSFLMNIKQDGKALPNGPVVISPDGLFPSLYREVIRRAPQEFKIACLEDIKALFPPDHNPFYAGFGNRDTDELSYRKIGIPKGKIFIINPKGEVAISQHRIDVKSYTSLHTLVNDMFPPTSTASTEQEDFNSWNYWRMPLPDID